MVYHGKEYKEESGRGKKKNTDKRTKPQQWLLDQLWNRLRKSAQSNRGEKGWTCYYGGNRGISSWIALRHLSCTQLHVWSIKWPHLRRGWPLRHRRQWLDSQGNRDWKCPGVPTQAPILITPVEPWGLITVGGQLINFLLDTGATFSVLTEAPGPLSSWSTTVTGLSGWAKCYYFSHSLSCSLDSVLFSWVSNHATILLTPSGEGYTEQSPGLCFHK